MTIIGGVGNISILDPPEMVHAIKCSRGDEHRQPVCNRRSWSIIDLNTNVRHGNPPRNFSHWPLSAVVREIMANALDAAFQANSNTWGDIDPVINVVNSDDRMAGYYSLNGAMAASWAITVNRVELNPACNIEKDSYEVHPPWKEVGKTDQKKKLEESKPIKPEMLDFDDSGSDDDNSSTNNHSELRNLNMFNGEKFRVSLLVRSFSTMPLEAWINGFTSKNDKADSKILRIPSV